MKRLVSEETVGLLGGRLEVLFFDVTTLSFASEQSDELRKKGFSKDGKPHKVPLVLALIQTKEGLPITYELFPCNTTDVKTLEPEMQELQARFDLDRLIVVADSGMSSKENLALLQSLGCDYIVAARLRSLRPLHTEKILGEQTWTVFGHGAEGHRTHAWREALDSSPLSKEGEPRCPFTGTGRGESHEALEPDRKRPRQEWTVSEG